MFRIDILVIMLVLYLGLSAWAYRDVGVKRPKAIQPAVTPKPVRQKTHASYWQIVLSVVALCLGAVLITVGVGFVLQGVIGGTEWTAFTLGARFPVNDVFTGLMLALLGTLLVYETRYTIIKHPRPPRRFTRGHA